MLCDARGGGPEQAEMLCKLSGSDGFDNCCLTNNQTVSAAENGGYLNLYILIH